MPRKPKPTLLEHKAEGSLHLQAGLLHKQVVRQSQT